jgi:hypothetical protein
MADLYLIVEPVGHRQHEGDTMREAQRNLALEDDQTIHLFVIPEPDDGWWCDHCDAAIDLEEGAIVSVNNSALCHHCAPKYLRHLPVTVDGSSVILPACSCAACTPIGQPRSNPKQRS